MVDVLEESKQLTEKMPKSREREPIFDMVIQLMEAAVEFSCQNFVSLISGDMLWKIDKVSRARNFHLSYRPDKWFCKKDKLKC